MSLFCNKTFKRWQQKLRAFICWMGNLTNMFLVFTPSVRVEHVLRTPSVGTTGICGVYVILILKA